MVLAAGQSTRQVLLSSVCGVTAGEEAPAVSMLGFCLLVAVECHVPEPNI